MTARLPVCTKEEQRPVIRFLWAVDQGHKWTADLQHNIRKRVSWQRNIYEWIIRFKKRLHKCRCRRAIGKVAFFLLQPILEKTQLPNRPIYWRILYKLTAITLLIAIFLFRTMFLRQDTLTVLRKKPTKLGPIDRARYYLRTTEPIQGRILYILWHVTTKTDPW
jgi:hypothetical protein